jgi:hypothetical protein
LSDYYKPLDPVAKLIISLKANRVFNSDQDLADFSGLPIRFIENIHLHPEYDEVYASESERYLQKRMFEGGMSVEEFVNSEVKSSLLSLVAMRDSARVKDSVKLKAIQELLNRAEEAPRVRKQESEIQERIILQVPYAQIETIKQLADEEGHPELIEMLEKGDSSE